jgi:SET domain-containing protein
MSPLPQLVIRSAGAKGLGVFSDSAIPEGALICNLEGVRLQTADLTDDLLALQIGPDEWLCSDGSRVDDRINHSCTPNAGFVTGKLALYALRTIAAGEEISWDYSTSLNWPDWTLDCCCGSPDCRGTVVSWHALPREVRDRLRSIALEYLRTLPDIPEDRP